MPQSNSTGINVGAVIGSLIGGILLTVGSFLSYKWYKNSKEQNNAIPTSGDERNNYSQETSREKTTSQIQQVTIPIPEDAKPSVRDEINRYNNDNNVDNRNFNQGSE